MSCGKIASPARCGRPCVRRTVPATRTRPSRRRQARRIFPVCSRLMGHGRAPRFQASGAPLGIGNRPISEREPFHTVIALRASRAANPAVARYGTPAARYGSFLTESVTIVRSRAIPGAVCSATHRICSIQSIIRMRPNPMPGKRWGRSEVSGANCEQGYPQHRGRGLAGRARDISRVV